MEPISVLEGRHEWVVTRRDLNATDDPRSSVLPCGGCSGTTTQVVSRGVKTRSKRKQQTEHGQEGGKCERVRGRELLVPIRDIGHRTFNRITRVEKVANLNLKLEGSRLPVSTRAGRWLVRADQQHWRVLAFDEQAKPRTQQHRTQNK